MNFHSFYFFLLWFLHLLSIYKNIWSTRINSTVIPWITRRTTTDCTHWTYWTLLKLQMGHSHSWVIVETKRSSCRSDLLSSHLISRYVNIWLVWEWWSREREREWWFIRSHLLYKPWPYAPANGHEWQWVSVWDDWLITLKCLT